MRFSPTHILRVLIALIAGWSTTAGGAAQEQRVSLPDVMPGLTFLRRENPPYRNFAFDNYISIPIAQIFYELTVDPEIVEEYIFSGQTPTSLDHIHLIRGVRE